MVDVTDQYVPGDDHASYHRINHSPPDSSPTQPADDDSFESSNGGNMPHGFRGDIAREACDTNGNANMEENLASVIEHDEEEIDYQSQRHRGKGHGIFEVPVTGLPLTTDSLVEITTPTKNQDGSAESDNEDHHPHPSSPSITNNDNDPTFPTNHPHTTVYMSPVPESHNVRHQYTQPVAAVGSCGMQPMTSSTIVYTRVATDEPMVVSTGVHQSAKMSHQLSLDSSDSRNLLFSGVQTISEQLPLILTEGDAEEHDSLTVVSGSEQLQAVSTQAVLGGNPGSATGGVMVLSSNDIAPTGQLIPISGTNLVVLQSIDSEGQLVQPSPMLISGQHAAHLTTKPSDQIRMTLHNKSGGKQYHCPEGSCQKIASTSSKLKLHMLTHTGERPHKCPLEGCDWAFTTAYKLKRHIRGHTGERPFVCDYSDCGKTFTTTYNLKTHQKAHIREQDNVCSTQNCGQSFTTLHKLKAHEKKHELENELHTCDFENCGKTFKSLGNYNAHAKTHTGERPHACAVEGCDKRFTKASKLKLHMRSHTGERPFVCEEEGCDWSFTSSYKLKRHMRKHTGERPFTCEFPGCGKSFTRASHMRTHALSHTGQKPFVCPLQDCLKGFTAASSLNIHLRKHSNDKPFKCPVEGCGKAYTTGANLRLHQKRHEEKTLSQDEDMEKEEEEGTDHARPIRYVEIGGVNSVVDTDTNPVSTAPYSVMHTFAGEDFASEEVPSLTVVQFSSEETFPPQTPVASSGICFQFSANDGGHGNGSFTAASTPLPSPGAHCTQSTMGEEEMDETNERQNRRSNSTPEESTTGDHRQGFLLRGQQVRRGLNAEDSNSGFILRGQQGRRGLNVSRGKNNDLTLPTMVVFTPATTASSEAASPITRPQSDDNARGSEDDSGSRNNTTTESDMEGHLTLERPCENSAIDQFAPPAIIFQGEEVKSSENEVKLAYTSTPSRARHNIKDSVRTESLLPVPCSASSSARPSNLQLHVSNLNLNLSSLEHDIDKSPPGSAFIDADDVDHETTINLQDLR